MNGKSSFLFQLKNVKFVRNYFSLLIFFPNPYVNRDAIIYGASCFTSGLPTVIKVLSEGVLQPRLTDQEVMIIDYYTQRTVEFDY